MTMSNNTPYGNKKDEVCLIKEDVEIHHRFIHQEQVKGSVKFWNTFWLGVLVYINYYTFTHLDPKNSVDTIIVLCTISLDITVCMVSLIPYTIINIIAPLISKINDYLDKNF